jgi:hypothetical protein
MPIARPSKNNGNQGFSGENYAPMRENFTHNA